MVSNRPTFVCNVLEEGEVTQKVFLPAFDNETRHFSNRQSIVL